MCRAHFIATHPEKGSLENTITLDREHTSTKARKSPLINSSRIKIKIKIKRFSIGSRLLLGAASNRIHYKLEMIEILQP